MLKNATIFFGIFLYYKDSVPVPISIFLYKVSVAQKHVIML